MSTVNSTKYYYDSVEEYESLSKDFEKFHKEPVNVILHFVTTPLGIMGLVSFIRYMTKSSSTGFAFTLCYLASLLPIIPNGVFVGTGLLSMAILFFARQLRLNWFASLSIIVIGYILQDFAHLVAGEDTYQSSYSAGGHVDLNKPLEWLWNIGKHTYYLLPLCVNLVMPRINDFISDNGIKTFLESPIPPSIQNLHVFRYLLGPLFVAALGSYSLDSKNWFCFFPGTPYFHRVLQCNIAEPDNENDESNKSDLQKIRKWVMDKNPASDKSSHWWFKDLNEECRKSFERCANSQRIFAMFRSLFSKQNYTVEVVEGMNEIYVTGPDRLEENSQNSDQVFYTRHVDGPFGIIPFVSVYRCIVGMDKNMMITTHFPLANLSVNACEGDVLAFDFNREVHNITKDDSKKDESDDFRVVLKLHYCVYPRVLAPLGWLMHWLNVKYNQCFRALFLKTIAPKTPYEHFLAWNVNFNTQLLDLVESRFGIRNIFYFAVCGALWHATGCYEVFLCLTSFVHYFRYISTFYVRRGIDFGSFKRDVLLFKTSALFQLFYHYIFSLRESGFKVDYLSICMIVAGYVVSILATNALGMDRTYFGAELGLMEPKWVTQFPYGYIPHPMIVSQVFSLSGFFKAKHFRSEWPWGYIVPIHITLYLIHMLQEHFDIYKRYPENTPAKKEKNL